MKVSALTIMDNYTGLGRSVGELYEQTRWECQTAERLGLYGYFVAEHHFSDYGVAPDPLLMLASLAADTSSIKLGTGISIATFRDPRIAAGSYCMLDRLCKGRFLLGLGSGFLPNEFEALGIELRSKRAIFDEALAVIKALVRGEASTFDGAYFQCNGVQLNVPPFHADGPPLYIAVMAREAFRHAAAKGEALIAAPYASLSHFDELPALISEINEVRDRHGVPHREDIWSMHCFIDDTDAMAVTRARKHFELYMDTRLYATKISYEDFLDRELSLIGSIDTVAGKIKKLEQWGVQHILLCFNFGLMERSDIENSMMLMMKEVLGQPWEEPARPVNN